MYEYWGYWLHELHWKWIELYLLPEVEEWFVYYSWVLDEEAITIIEKMYRDAWISSDLKFVYASDKDIEKSKEIAKTAIIDEEDRKKIFADN